MAEHNTRALTKLKKFRGPAEKVLFPLILLFWPMAAANQGISVMDTTYSLANYAYPDTVNSMWKFATFLANVIGSAIMRTPAGKSLLAMNIICSLFVSLTALCAYFVLKRMIAGWMVFLGEFLAISLCWCPPVILYNYLTYLFLTLGCLCLLLAVRGDPEKKQLYVLAGVFLGANVTVRFSNAAEAALIFALWFWCGVTGKKVRGAVTRTLLCLLGYVIGFAVPVAASAVLYGPGAYFEMIPQLFGIQGSAGDYTLGGMLTATLRAYLASFRWLLVLIPCAVLGMILFRIPLLSSRKWVKRLIYLAGLLVVIRFFYGRGMFTRVYTDYWCWFQWGMLLLIVTLLLCVTFMAGRFAADPGERFLAAMVLVLVLILPLGSNNYTFPVFNCLFVTAPAVLWMLGRVWQGTKHRDLYAAWHGMAVMILVMTFLQGALFHVSFAFRDGTDGTPRDAMVEGNTVTAGMYTTRQNAEELTELTAAAGALTGKKTIVFGDAPGLHYLLSLEPAIDTTWPDLDSYSTEHFGQELARLGEEGTSPVVILHHEETPQSASSGEKQALLERFMEQNGYTVRWENGAYSIWCAPGEETHCIGVQALRGMQQLLMIKEETCTEFPLMCRPLQAERWKTSALPLRRTTRSAGTVPLRKSARPFWRRRRGHRSACSQHPGPMPWRWLRI